MATLTLAFEKEINVSLQIGDYVFYTNSVTTDKNIDHAGGWPTMVGVVEDIGYDATNYPTAPYIVEVDNADSTLMGLGLITGTTTVPTDAFVMFAKDSSINMSGIKGYFAEVTMQNDATGKAEMFSLASEISISSK